MTIPAPNEVIEDEAIYVDGVPYGCRSFPA